MSTSSRRRSRARLVAACTGLAAMAGLMLAQPAAAEDPAPPAPAKALPRLDLSGDGKGEMVYRPFAGALQVRNTMTSSLAWEFHLQEDLPGAVSFKDYIPVGDQDGDGAPEILALTADGALHLVRTRPNRNDGVVAANSQVGWGWQIYNKVLSPGDLSGDTRPDLLARTPAGELYFYPSTGNTAAPFGPRVRVATGWQVYDQLVGVTDGNGDGVGDVVTRNPYGELFFHSGVPGASPSFLSPLRVGHGWGIYNQIAGGDDMDGDGIGDLAGRTTDGMLYVYKGLGQGGFAPRALSAWGYGWHNADVLFGAGGNPGYGKTRIQGLGTDGKLYSYQAVGDGTLAQRRAVPSPYFCSISSGTKSIVLASDLVLDGRPDLLALCKDGYLTGGSEAQSTIGGGWGVYNALVGPGDLTGDGKGDLIARDASGTLYLYRSIGDPRDPFTAFATRVKVGGGWNAYDRIVGAGDYTGDGRADIVARTPSGVLYVYAGTGSAATPFASRVEVGRGWQIYGKLAAIGDADGDGRGELLAVDRDGKLYRYGSNGSAPGIGLFRPRALVGGGWNIYRELH
ncbi:FG-GAP repeat domain-containing protein [Streptomyces sp. NPDC014870]|uniref:FG-GAP repeat domain-containing protein n=1 Tax=Streptomyces sp. NPDC014870 TaxID=3364925 RepID=UPI0036F9241A